MMSAAEIPAFADGARVPDADNPRGYFEHEQAMRLHQDSSWLPQARGKAVKIVAPLLLYLPAGEQYRLIFMHRALEEVVASQRAMLARLQREGGRLDDRALMRAYTSQSVRVQTWLARRPETPVLAISYADAAADAAATAGRLATFLSDPFDAVAAASAVDPSLRRQGVRRVAS